MKKKSMKAILLAAATVLTVGSLAGCGTTATESEVSTDAAETVSEETAGEDATSEDAASEATAEDTAEETTGDVVTVQDIYDANGITDILSRHKTVTVDYQSKQGTDDILGTATAQITMMDDGDVQFVETMDNGEDIYDIESYQNGGFTYVYNETTKESAAGIIHPEDYIYYIQQEAYLEPYTSYEYTNITNEMQDGALIVSADIDDVGQLYIFADPDNYEIYALDYEFTSGTSVVYSLVYDSPEDLDITVLDDALAGDTSTVTMEYINSSYSEDYDYEIPVGATAYSLGLMTFDLYTDAECSDDNFIMEFVVDDQPMTIYAKYVE